MKHDEPPASEPKPVKLDEFVGDECNADAEEDAGLDEAIEQGRTEIEANALDKELTGLPLSSGGICLVAGQNGPRVQILQEYLK